MTPTNVSTAPPAAAAPVQKSAAPAAASDEPSPDQDFLQTLVAMLVGEGSADAKPAAKSLKEPAEGAADATQAGTPVDPATLIAIILPTPGSIPTQSKKLPAEFSDLEALLGVDANKSSAAAANAVLGDALDVIAAKGDGTADQTATTPSAFASSLNSAQQPAATSVTAEVSAHKELRAPVGSQAWSGELGTQLSWMVEKGHQAASLRLSPEHLGPLEVRIDVRDNQATVWFGATHSDTRAALEQALPRLREMFAAQGLSLSDAGVFKEAPRDQSRSGFHSSNGSGRSGDDSDQAITGVGARTGLLDAYA